MQLAVHSLLRTLESFSEQKEVALPEESKPFKLCYVTDNWAYFTTQELEKQWGDDWNDAPYECNAGRPYFPRENTNEQWDILKVAWEGPFVTPDYGHFNSPYSVQQINAGVIAWLSTENWCKKVVAIKAGTSLEEFVELINSVGGKVYTELKE